MKRLFAAAGLTAALLAGPALATNSGRIVLPANAVPSHYDLAITPDAKHLTFTGTVKIDIDLKKASRTIELNAADLIFHHISLTGERAAPKVSFDTTEQTATLTFAKPASAGHHVLEISYSGKIYQHAAGFFALDYKTAKGTKRALYTQFENSDARRFVPSWDEPAHKATFTLTATVPADEMAISNMPIATTDKLPGGLKRVTFQQSPKMSSYLLFFGLGDFERITRKVNGVDIGVIVTRGDTERGKFALNAASQILPYYEKYFDVKYPLPKLDLIAGPGESQFFGAMENWGAIFFFDRDLLIDPKTSTESQKRNVYITVAHEMAHQWFGDLVTMQWWDDIWLNEGFASWMELKVTNHFHPEWKPWLEGMGGKEYAMSIDARKGTHPIIQPIHDVMQANEAFDAITYLKGQSVIRMLEDYLGPEKFRAGVRTYIKAHEYGNAVTDELWTALDKVQTVPVAKIAHDFTLQAGVPLIRVTRTGNDITLTQDRFTADKSGKAKRTWDVPVIVKVLGNKFEWRGLVSAGHPAHLSLADGAVPVVNAGQGGYYRTLYTGPLAHSIARHFGDLSPADQLGTLADASALGFAGYEPLANFLDLTATAKPGMNPLVLRAIAGGMEEIDSYYRGRPGRAAFRAYATGLLDPVFAQVGWTPKKGEGPNVPLLRSALLSVLSRLGDKTVIAEAETRFSAYLKDPASLSPEMRHNVLGIVAANATPKIWDELHKLAKTAPTALLRSQLYADLGRASDPALARRALALALSDEAPVTVRPSIIRTVAGSEHPDMAFNFTMAHLDKINSWLEPDSRNEFAARTAAGTFDPATLKKLKAYVAAKIPPTARGTATTVEAAIAYTIHVRQDRMPAVDKWLAARQKVSGGLAVAKEPRIR